jgi:two-component system LytT family response regulator
VKLHTAENTFVKKKTLSFYENSLNKNQFVRCHRSYLVNIASITAMDHSGGDTWEIRLKDGFHLPVSRQGYGRLKEVLGL